MKHRAILIMVLVLFSRCMSSLPDHRDLQTVTTQSEVLRIFGEPKSIHRINISPDVANASDLRRGGLRITLYERWTYDSKSISDNSGAGSSVITFRISNDGTKGFAEGISWMPAIKADRHVGDNGTQQTSQKRQWP